VKKNSHKITSLFFALVVWLAIVLQSIHAIGHIGHEISQKKCHHHYTQGKAQITHAHQGFEKCFSCEFAFSSAVKNTSENTFKHQVCYFNKQQKVYYNFVKKTHKSTYFSLRAPPLV